MKSTNTHITHTTLYAIPHLRTVGGLSINKHTLWECPANAIFRKTTINCHTTSVLAAWRSGPLPHGSLKTIVATSGAARQARAGPGSMSLPERPEDLGFSSFGTNKCYLTFPLVALLQCNKTCKCKSDETIGKVSLYI